MTQTAINQKAAHQPQTDNSIEQTASLENGFIVYLKYLAQHLGHMSWLFTEQDDQGLWDTFSKSRYCNRIDVSPVIILETLRRRREQVGVYPTLSMNDLSVIKSAYIEQRF